MTLEILTGILAMIISLLASYVPGFSKWFGGLTADVKRLVMLGLLALTSLLVFAVACTTYAEQFGIALACSEEGAITLFKVFGAAVIANQATYALTPASSSRS